MERKIFIDQTKLDTPNTNVFALQHALKGVGVSREYKVDDTWTGNKPERKPEGTRVVFDSLDSLRAARDTYNAWVDIDRMRRFRPEYPTKSIQRLLNARTTNEPLPLFVPWGVRPEGEFGASELQVMDMLKNFQTILAQRNIPTELLLMPADLYATEVNNQVGNQRVENYFSTVRDIAQNQFDFTVVPWSQIRTDNLTAYNQRDNELTQDAIKQVIPRGKIRSAIEAAGRRSGYTNPTDIRNSAFAYMKERICEAEIVEKAYKPIKVSVVPRERDNHLDRGLPRLYLFTPEQQFPWLK